MCLAIPGKVLSVSEEGPLARRARVDFGGTVRETNLSLLPEANAGDWVLVHVGIDTVQMEGKGFTLDVAKDARVEEGDLLAKVDLDAVKAAGFDTTTIVVVINTAALAEVKPTAGGTVANGDTVIDVTV